MSSTFFSKTENIEYDLSRKQVRRLTLSISKSGRVCVRAPIGMRQSQVDAFVDEKHRWIRKHLHAYQSYIFLPQIEDHEKKKCRQQVLLRASELMSNDMQPRPKKIFVRFSSTRWGSCSSLGNISLNGYLAYLPDPLFEYVFWHEVTHLSCMNHSSHFWSLLEKKVAEPKTCRARLKHYRLP